MPNPPSGTLLRQASRKNLKTCFANINKINEMIQNTVFHSCSHALPLGVVDLRNSFLGTPCFASSGSSTSGMYVLEVHVCCPTGPKWSNNLGKNRKCLLPRESWQLALPPWIGRTVFSARADVSAEKSRMFQIRLHRVSAHDPFVHTRDRDRKARHIHPQA